MANRNWSSGGKIYSMHTTPVLIDCNFVVDSTNANGLGLSSLKGPCVSSVYMHTSATPALGNPNPGASILVGAPSLGTSASYAALAASTITNTGNSVLTGDLGLSPGTSVAGFPPGIVSGTKHITDSAAAQAQIDAMAAYTFMQAQSSTVIPSALDAQVLSPGVYSFTSGSASLATSAPGVLTFNGPASAVFIIKTASTLVTGAGGAATMVFTGGAGPSNVFWAIGSSATLNVTGTSIFAGHLIAQASVTVTSGGISTVNGTLAALTGAITFSAATIVNAPAVQDSGVIIVQLSDNYSRLFSMFNSVSSPISGAVLTSVIKGNAYVIQSLGTATVAQFQAKGLRLGFVPAVGASFIATASGSIGGAAVVELSAAAGSNITNIEIIGDPNMTISSSSVGVGAQIILQCYKNGVKVSPADGTLIRLAFYLSNSSVTIQGE